MEDLRTDWGMFSMQLLGLLQQLPPCPAMDAPDLDPSKINFDELMFRLEETEKPAADAIDSAIRAWPDDPNPWELLSNLGLYYLRLRIDTAMQFSLQFCTCGNHPETSFLGFPHEVSRFDVARFLFIDWWKSHGRHNAATAILVEGHDRTIQK